ncbi:MAG: DUF4157 domain-containing protein [Actinomycetia bacterium]|nr:DUF4157 domain-containing protein [Actinomycetes bacterium]
MIQTKLKINEPEDPYEQEADSVAKQVPGIQQHLENEVFQAKLVITPLVWRRAEEDSIQAMFASVLTGNLQAKTEASQNKSDIPDNLKSGLEKLSGINLSSVRVHHNSSKPAQLNALAYTQGQDIHVGPEQEKYLPHEGWHAVQQMQGRVTPTMQTNGVAINDDAGLEQEADVMGAKALKMIHKSIKQRWSQDHGIMFLQREVETKGESEVSDEGIGVSERQIGDTYKKDVDAIADEVEWVDSTESILDQTSNTGWVSTAQQSVSQMQKKPHKRQRAKSRSKTETKTILSEKPTTERNAAKTTALTNIRQLERQIIVNMREWRIAARNVGSGYEMAGTRHTTACQKAASAKALNEAIFFGILTMASAGVLSWMSTVVQKKRHTLDVFYNYLEDTVQSGVGEGIDVFQAGVAPSSKAVNKGYLSYQNNMLNHLDDLMNNVTKYFIDVVNELQENPWSSWDGFDSTKQVEKYNVWLKKSKLSDIPTVPTNDKIADSLETDMWARWVPGLIVEKHTFTGNIGRHVKYEDITDPGPAVEERLNKLKITSSAGIGKEFHSWWTFDSDVRKLRIWAYRHSPKKILDLGDKSLLIDNG